MRKVTEQTVTAFFANTNKTVGATTAKQTDEGCELILHGSVIANKVKNKLYINHHGYTTNTTKERLNGVLEIGGYDVTIRQKQHEWFIGNTPMKSGWNLITKG